MMRFLLVTLVSLGLLGVALAIVTHSFALLFLGLALLSAVPMALRRFTTVATIAASSLATLSIVELTLAGLEPAPTPRPRLAGDALRPNEAITDIGRVALGGRYAVQRVAADGDTLFDVVYTLDAEGFRVTPGDEAGHGADVSLLGCSFAFGEGLEDDETLAFHLQRTLGIGVRNFGYIGGGPHQALVILESDRDTSGPVNLLLTAPWQAPRSACAVSWSGGAPRFRLDAEGALRRDGVCPARGAPPLTRALRRSALFRLAERAYQVLWREAITERQLALYHALVDRIADLSRERGQALVIAYIGADEINGVSLDNARTIERLAASGATVVDVSLAASEAALAPAYYIHKLDRHPSALANERRAELLAPVLAPLLKD